MPCPLDPGLGPSPDPGPGQGHLQRLPGYLGLLGILVMFCSFCQSLRNFSTVFVKVDSLETVWNLLAVSVNVAKVICNTVYLRFKKNIRNTKILKVKKLRQNRGKQN